MADLSIKSKDIDLNKFTVENLAKMKEQFPNLDNDTLARFLIARNNRLKNAVPLLQSAEAWRAVHYPVLKEDCINEISKGKVYVRGVDKEGHPLMIVRGRFHNPKDRSIEEMGKMALWWAEQAVHSMPDDKSKYTILFDRSETGLHNQDIEFARYFIQFFQRLYPERLHTAVVYPSGVLFWGLWAIVKMFLDPVTRNKVKPCMYFSGVQDVIEDQYLPAIMGGKCTYEFNADDFKDPYPEEILQAAQAGRAEGKLPAPFSVPNDEKSMMAHEDEEDDEDA